MLRRWLTVLGKQRWATDKQPSAMPALSARPRSGDSVDDAISVARLDAQVDQINNIDTKAGTLFLIASGVLPVTASLLGVSDLGIEDSWTGKLALTASLVSYLWIVVHFKLAYGLSEWGYRPNLESLKEFKRGRSEEIVQGWVANQCRQSYYENEPKILKKVGYVDRMVWGVVIEIIALTLAVLLPLFP